MRTALALLLSLVAAAPASAAPRHHELVRGISDARYFTVNPQLRALGFERTRDARGDDVLRGGRNRVVR